jgi:hypothetical protein
MSPTRGMTRRRLLATGGAAGAAAVVGFQPWSPAAAKAAAGDSPAYLRRSSYLALSSPDFSTSRLGQLAGVKLASVADLGAADVDKALVNNDDAFALMFTSDTAFEAGTRTFAHPDFGVFELFIAPVEGRGSYEVIVNRTVGVPKRAPQPPPPQSGSSAPVDKKPPATKKHGPPPNVRTAHLRRVGKDVVAQIGLEPGAHVKSVAVWLTRGGLVVAAGSERHLHGHDRLNLRLPMHKRLRGGRYELTVGTKDRGGHSEYKRVKIALQ